MSEGTLDALREAGFTEGQRCYDSRAGLCEIETLDQVVLIETKQGQRTPLLADELLKSYHNGGIQPVDHS